MKLFKKKEPYEIFDEWENAMEKLTEKYQKKLGNANIQLVFETWDAARFPKPKDPLERNDIESWDMI